MKEHEVGVEQGFYQAVAEVLECDSHYKAFPFGRRTRWNNRKPGNGRFEGHGLVRYYGPTNIHVALYNPPMNGCFTSAQNALAAIELTLSGSIPTVAETSAGEL